MQRPLRDPGMCPHCLKGKGKDTPSLKLSGSFVENVLPRICLDYCFPTENELGRDETTEGDEVVEKPDKIEGKSQTVHGHRGRGDSSDL